MRHFSSAIVIALGLALAVLILRQPASVEAAGSTSDIRVFRRTFNPGQTRVLGTVPVNHTIILHDFISSIGGGTFQVLGNGVQIMPTLRVGGGTVDAKLSFSFSAGIPVAAGTQLSIRRVDTFGVPADLQVGLTVQ